MSEPEPRRPSPAEGVLAQLLHDTLDEGYAMVAKQRAERSPAGTPDANPARREFRSDSALTAFACVLIGLVLVVAYVHTNRAAPTDSRTRADLITRIKQAQKDSAELQRQAQSLAAQVDAQRTGALGGVAAGSVLASAQAQAGTTAVRGPGVRVLLGNPDTPTAGASTGRAGSTPISALSVLTDVDVRAVVNELWHDGAEAIAVNGVRLTPISAIRFAGEVVLVDFQPITSPYSIEAIGNSDTMITSFTDSATASKYHTLASADGYQFSTAQVKSLDLAASVLSAPRYAHVPRRQHTDDHPRAEPYTDRWDALVIAAAALVLGLILGLVLHPTVPGVLEPYLPIAVVAALDAVFGGIRARLDGIFDAKVFVVSFISNSLVAALIVFLGDKLGAGSQLSTAVVVVLGIRIFGNAAAIRRHIFRA